MKKAKEPEKKSKAWVWILLLLFLLTGGSAWAFWSRKDPQIAKIEDIRTQLQADGLERDKRRELYGQMREEFEKLTPEARDAMFAERWKEREKRDDERMKEFFAMPRDKQIAEIDKRIAEQKARAKARANGKGGDRGRGGRGGPGGPGGGGPGGGGPGGGGRGGAGRGQNFGTNASGQNASVERRKDFLDRSTPGSRARRDEYRRMSIERARQS